MPDTQHQTGSAEAETIEKDTEAKLEGNEGKPEIQPVAQVREEMEKEEQDGEIFVKKEQRHVYEYPDFNISASSSRYRLAGSRFFWKMPFRHQLYQQLQDPQPAHGSDSEDESSPPRTPTQVVPKEDLDPRIFAPTGDIYSYFQRRRLDPHLFMMPMRGDVQRRLGGRVIVY